VDGRKQQASLRQAHEMLHGARPQARLRAASRLQELALAPEKHVGAPAAWQQLGLAREKSLPAPQAERPRALE